MIAYAAEATWGIPGPTFLVLYLGAAAVITVLGVVHRRRLFAGASDVQVDRLGPQSVAYLNAGPRLAVYTALGGLRAADAIGTADDKTLVQTGPMPSGATPLDSAVYNAAGKRIQARTLHADPWVVAAVNQLRDSLESAGLAVPAGHRRTARTWALVGVAVVIVGVIRALAGASNNRPIGFLLLSIVAVLVLFGFGLFRIPNQTRAATKALADLRTRHAHLAPASSPAYATYGASGAAMGVALYGSSTLFAIDPAFAAEAEVQRVAALGSTGSSYDAGSGGSSCSSGSSCGGGGGGSSCGGGGGGGCGG
jgi:uncharacterized protein (TIGR04222 family)